MKNILLLLSMIITIGVYGQSKSYDYAYMNKKGICVYSVADKKEVLITKKGQDPYISPDGKKLAYSSSNDKGDRFIDVVDLNTRRKIILNTQNNNSYGPVWSPDGGLIAYNSFDSKNAKWYIALIDSGNTNLRILTGQIENSYVPSWLANSQNVVAQNLDNVYVVNLSGDIIKSYKIADLSKAMGASSSDRFIFTDDNKKIVFSEDVDEPGESDGPPSAVFVYDIANKSTLRLSPKGYFANEVFVKGNKVLFTASKLNSRVQNVFSVDVNGKNFKVLFPGCSSVSAKR